MTGAEPGDVGARIRAARRRLGWTQVRVGRAIGVTDQYVSAVELGRRKPSAELLAWLAAAEASTAADSRDDR